MIELPEAVVLAEQINRTLQGKRITQAVANQWPHKFAWYSGDPAEYDGHLAGKVIGPATYHGGYVEIKAGDVVLVTSTPLRYHAAGERRPPKHQLLLEFDDGTALSATVQMWGALLCHKDDDSDNLPDGDIARRRPSPLSAAFDRAYFDGLVDEQTGALSAKAFLATEQRIPGLGNGVLHDILWTARVHPKRRVATLSPEAVDRMYGAIRSVLRAMVDQGGRDTERDLFGRPGGYASVMSKNTVGKPCPACGSPIQKEAYLGGTIYYCGGCQALVR